MIDPDAAGNRLRGAGRLRDLEANASRLESLRAVNEARIQELSNALERERKGVDDEAAVHPENLGATMAERERALAIVRTHALARLRVQDQERIQQLTERVDDLDKTLAEKQARLSQLEARTRQTEEELARREDDLEQLRHQSQEQIKGLTGQVGSFKATLSEREQELGNLRSYTADLERVVEEKQEEVQGLRSELESAQEALRRINSSRWVRALRRARLNL
jgi:chromosome segregation ATPase